MAVIGDGSLTGGMAYEALNNAARLDTNYIIVLNDNNMSISENVGGVSKYLNNVRTADGYLDLRDGVYNTLKDMPKYGNQMVKFIRRAKNSFKQLVIPGMFFEDMGITYLGPVDGHNIGQMVRVFHEAKRVKKAVLIHVQTQKGKDICQRRGIRQDFTGRNLCRGDRASCPSENEGKLHGYFFYRYDEAGAEGREGGSDYGSYARRNRTKAFS